MKNLIRNLRFERIWIGWFFFLVFSPPSFFSNRKSFISPIMFISSYFYWCLHLVEKKLENESYDIIALYARIFGFYFQLWGMFLNTVEVWSLLVFLAYSIIFWILQSVQSWHMVRDVKFHARNEFIFLPCQLWEIFS